MEGQRNCFCIKLLYVFKKEHIKKFTFVEGFLDGSQGRCDAPRWMMMANQSEHRVVVFVETIFIKAEI